MTNSDCPVYTGVSAREEADSYTILHIAEVTETLIGVHAYSKDTGVLHWPFTWHHNWAANQQWLWAPGSVIKKCS